MSLNRLLGMGVDFDEDNLMSPRDLNSTFLNLFSPMMRPMNEFAPPMLLPSPFGGLGMGLGGMLGMMDMGGSPFMDLRTPFMQDITSNLPSNPVQTGGQVYYSSNFVTMTNGPDGRPEVYQASSSMRSGPGGVKETMKAVSDSRSGVKKMQIGHHIGEKGHVIERERNYRSGTAEERQEFINIEEEEADSFESTWQNLAGRRQPTLLQIREHSDVRIGAPTRRHRVRARFPCLMDSSSNSKNVLRPIEGSQTRSIQSSDHRKKRPHEADKLHRRKNFRGTSQAGADPVPVVELPDSDSEESSSKTPQPTSVGPTIVEVLD